MMTEPTPALPRKVRGDGPEQVPHSRGPPDSDMCFHLSLAIPRNTLYNRIISTIRRAGEPKLSSVSQAISRRLTLGDDSKWQLLDPPPAPYTAVA